MPQRYANYSVNDFDQFDCVNLSKGLYITLAYLLRGYLIWLFSLTNMQDRTSILQWAYPDPKLFYLSLAAGIPALFVVLLLSLRRPKASAWIKAAWRKVRYFVVLALVFDATINFLGYWHWQLVTVDFLALALLLDVGFIGFTVISKRLAINIEEFPEPMPEK